MKVVQWQEVEESNLGVSLFGQSNTKSYSICLNILNINIEYMIFGGFFGRPFPRDLVLTTV